MSTSQFLVDMGQWAVLWWLAWRVGQLDRAKVSR